MPRPDKKSGAKKQMKGMEDLLRSIAGNTGLRKHCDFVKFLMPDDQFGRFTEGDHSEVVCHLSHTAWEQTVYIMYMCIQYKQWSRTVWARVSVCIAFFRVSVFTLYVYF